ncbi:MAG: hypothetical protein AAGD01_05100 [Acidobacteriota bacterium]
MSDESPSHASDNPPVVGIPSGSRKDLRDVAMYQKGIIFCILTQLFGAVAQVVLPGEARLLLLIVLLLVSVVSAVLVFLLAIRVYGTAVGLVLGLLALVPLLGLLILLIVNRKATGILRQNGIPVGLMGADSSQI